MARGSSLKRKTLTLTKKRNSKELKVFSDDEDENEKLDTNENSTLIKNELRSVGTKHLVYHREKFPCTCLLNDYYN